MCGKTQCKPSVATCQSSETAAAAVNSPVDQAKKTQQKSSSQTPAAAVVNDQWRSGQAKQRISSVVAAHPSQTPAVADRHDEVSQLIDSSNANVFNDLGTLHEHQQIIRVFDQVNQISVEHIEARDIDAFVTVDTDAGCINVPFHLETDPSDGEFNNELNDFSCDVDMYIDRLLSSGFLNESEGIFSCSDENTNEKPTFVEEQPLRDSHVEDNADQSSEEEFHETGQNIGIGALCKRRKKADPENGQ